MQRDYVLRWIEQLGELIRRLLRRGGSLEEGRRQVDDAIEALLGPLAAVVFIGGWALAVVAYFAVGSETCTEVNLGIAGQVNACTDTGPTQVILASVIGFGATISAVFLWGLRYLLESLETIGENTRRR